MHISNCSCEGLLQSIHKEEMFRVEIDGEAAEMRTSFKRITVKVAVWAKLNLQMHGNQHTVD